MTLHQLGRNRRLSRKAAALGLGIYFCVAYPASTAPTQSKGEKNRNREKTSSRTSVFVEEKGKLRILVDGQQAGSEEFQISQGNQRWVAHGKTEIHTSDGGTTQVTASMQLAPDGAPLNYQWSTQGEKKASANVDFQGGTAKMALHREASEPFIQELSFGAARVVILDNNLYHHYAILGRLYDWNAKGAQTFSVLIPQDLTPGSITVESLGQEAVDGATLNVLRVQSADLEIRLYLDESRRLARLSVPAAKVDIRRE